MAFDPNNPNVYHVSKGRGREREALIFTVSIFISLEPYGAASSWQKNK